MAFFPPTRFFLPRFEFFLVSFTLATGFHAPAPPPYPGLAAHNIRPPGLPRVQYFGITNFAVYQYTFSFFHCFLPGKFAPSVDPLTFLPSLHHAPDLSVWLTLGPLFFARNPLPFCCLPGFAVIVVSELLVFVPALSR